MSSPDPHTVIALAEAKARAGRLVIAAEVEPESVSWLWPGRIPLGKLTILDGDPGLGKSTLAIDLAARISQGAPMPDGARSDLVGPAGALFLAAEDGLADTWRPRLDAAGADVSRVAALRAVKGEDGEPDRFPTVRDVRSLGNAIWRVRARLLVVDPLVAYLGGDVNSHRDQDVRGALAELAELADSEGVAILAIRHLNKGNAGNPLYRGGGSIGLIAAARSGLLVAKDPENPDGDRRILASTKANLAAPPRSLAYRLEPTPDGAVRVAWEGETRHTAAQLLDAPDGAERTALEEARAFLEVELRDGPVGAKKLQARARDAGHAIRTLRRAADALGVEKRKPGFETGWEWSLPPIAPNSGPFADGTGQEPASSKGSAEGATGLGPFGERQSAQGDSASSGDEGASGEKGTRARDRESF